MQIIRFLISALLALQALAAPLELAIEGEEAGYIGCYAGSSNTDTIMYVAGPDRDVGVLCARYCKENHSKYFGLTKARLDGQIECGCFNRELPNLERLTKCDQLCQYSDFRCGITFVTVLPFRCSYAVYDVEEKAGGILHKNYVNIVMQLQKDLAMMPTDDAPPREELVEKANQQIRDLYIQSKPILPKDWQGSSLGDTLNLATVRNYAPAYGVITRSELYRDECFRQVGGAGAVYSSASTSSTEETLTKFSAEAQITTRFSGFSATISSNYNSVSKGSRSIAYGIYYMMQSPDPAFFSITDECLNNPEHYSNGYIAALNQLNPNPIPPPDEEENNEIYLQYERFLGQYGTHIIQTVRHGVSIRITRSDVVDEIATKEKLEADAEAKYLALVSTSGEVSYEDSDHLTTTESEAEVFIQGGSAELQTTLYQLFHSSKPGGKEFQQFIDQVMGLNSPSICAIEKAVGIDQHAIAMIPQNHPGKETIIKNLAIAMETYSRRLAFRPYCQKELWDPVTSTCIPTIFSTIAQLPLRLLFPYRSMHPLLVYMTRDPNSLALSPCRVQHNSVDATPIYGTRSDSVEASMAQQCTKPASEAEDPPRAYGDFLNWVVSQGQYPAVTSVVNFDFKSTWCPIFTTAAVGHLSLANLGLSACTSIKLVQHPTILNMLALYVNDTRAGEQAFVHYSNNGPLHVQPFNASTDPELSAVTFTFHRKLINEPKKDGDGTWWSKEPFCTADCDKGLCGNQERCLAYVKNPGKLGAADQAACFSGRKIYCEYNRNGFQYTAVHPRF